MKLLFASDSFKGSLSSEKTIELLTKAAKEVFPGCETEGIAAADGGEGTVDAVIRAERGERIYVPVKAPLGDTVNAYYGRLDDKKAVIEMASASGLTLVPEEKRNPLFTSSYGTGQLILDALDRGFREISIAIGGSATNDGGMGCMKALGVRFLDIHGHELSGCGKDLIETASIDVSGLDARIADTKITVMCDVKNPLCGKKGATYTFGGQKGGTIEILKRLEEGMQNYRDVLRRDFAVDCDAIEGAGAAGGLGAALYVFLHGKMKSGIDTVLDLIHFDDRLEGVTFVVTGEGRTDYQSCFGKVMQGVGERAKAKGIPVLGLSGSLGEGASALYEHGISSLMTTVDAPMELPEALEKAEELYYQGAVRMFRFVRAGMEAILTNGRLPLESIRINYKGGGKQCF